jgi:hypothetical protein
MKPVPIRPVAIGLAVFGALLSTAAPILRRPGRVTGRAAHVLDCAAPGFNGASMLLFVLAGRPGV